MKYNYYGHRSLGFIKDYFGDKGPKIKVSFLKYWWLKLTGYRVTKEPKCRLKNC